MQDTTTLPDRLGAMSPHTWAPALRAAAPPNPDLVNGHAHADTNPWGWDGPRMLAELWRRGVAGAGIAGFDSGAFIDGVAAAGRAAGVRVPGFIEALILTPEPDEDWNDLPGRAYLQAGPYAASTQAAALSDALTRLARRRAEYQAACWNRALDLGFEYRPDWERLSERGVTEANLARDAVDAIRAHSPAAAAVWRSISGLDADPADPNFARAFRNATMVAPAGVARVPRTSEFYLGTQEFVRLAEGRACYMYLGKSTGVEADLPNLLDRLSTLGFRRLCAIPQRNLGTPEKEQAFGSFLALLRERDLPTVLGTELNAHGQWWCVDWSQPPYREHRPWLEACWRGSVE